MQHLSIARSMRGALIALTIVLAAGTALGVASLYSARRHYENTLVQSSSLATAAANLAAAGIGANINQAGLVATSLAGSDPPSLSLIAAQIDAERRAAALLAAGHISAATAVNGPLARARSLAARVLARQRARQAAARSKARSDTRRALILVIAAGVLALLGALVLITGLVGSMRRPLDALVRATRSLAAGQLDTRVTPAGPSELRQLGEAFNSMGDELQRAHTALEAERRRLSVTIESLGDAVIVTEPGSSKIASTNPRALELLGEIVAEGRVDGDHSPLPPLEAALAEETTVEHAGRTLAITAAPLSSEADGIVWTIRDMTPRARLERAKSEFVATASHELRSPLTSIKGFVELLDRSPENMSERQREFVEIIHKSTDRLVELVNDLLDVARIEADYVEINRRPIDVGEAVREVVELMGPRIAAKHQTLGVYIAPALPMAFADAGRMRQIIANLLTNAHLYTGEGGRLHIGAEPDRAWVQIVVEDSGIGMTEDDVARVFERFYRARSARPEGQPIGINAGTGLGLSIVKSLVDLHRGRIEVDSEPGRGTIFKVLMPAALPGPESSRSLDAIRGRRVLIVDDEREIAELIAGQLSPMNVDVMIASSGEEALRRLRAEYYDAITLDILMPGMDGFEVLRQIRGDPDLRTTPIVFVSVFSGRHELAGEWVVSKPIDADELRDVLGAAVSSGRSRVLVVGREELQSVLEPSLDELGIDHEWQTSGAAAARVCGERRFEVALVDVGIRSPQAVLQALDLRGRRLRRTVIMFSDGLAPVPAGIERLGMEVVPVDEAASALVAALRGEREG
jgi:signal transduction histidine kinase/DNA-binding response OmpR family regulator/HAMP domain-containing protein